MRMSSLRLVFSLSTLFFLPNAVHARPVELSDFRRVLVNLQGFTDDQFATIDEKFEHKNRGWGLGLIFRLADPLSDSMATSSGTGGYARRRATAPVGRALRKWSRVGSPLGSVCSIGTTRSAFGSA